MKALHRVVRAAALIGLALVFPSAPPALAQVNLPPNRSIAVTIRASGEHTGKLAGHVAAAVAESLAKQPIFRVAAEDAVHGLPPEMRAADIAATLGVRFVLVGLMDGGPEIFRIALELVDVRGGTTVWSGSFFPEEDEMETVTDEIFAAVAGRLRDAPL